jgi:hypothetical protein
LFENMTKICGNKKNQWIQSFHFKWLFFSLIFFFSFGLASHFAHFRL